MKFLILSAVAALASARTVARSSEDYVQLKVGEDCMVVGDEIKEHEMYEIELKACDKEDKDLTFIKFAYDADDNQLKSDYHDLCLAVIEVNDHTKPGLAKCDDEENGAHEWKFIDGEKFLNEMQCECLTVDEEDIHFGDCKDAPKDELVGADAPEVVEAECQKPAETTTAPPAAETETTVVVVVDQCANVQCASPSFCKDGSCWIYYQCAANSQCQRGQVCQGGFCVWAQTQCKWDRDCPANYNCVNGQCRWCEPHKPTQPQCHRNSDCRVDQACEGSWCVSVSCAPGCLGQCVHGQCVGEPQCRSNNQCRLDQACEGGRCVSVSCNPGCVDCRHGTCYDRPVVPQCSSSQQCSINEACMSGQCVPASCGVCNGECRHGSCFPGCSSNNQCSVDEVCQAGACVTVSCDNCRTGRCVHGECQLTCLFDSQCPAGEKCELGQCVVKPDDCLADSQCPAGQKCEFGQCVITE